MKKSTFPLFTALIFAVHLLPAQTLLLPLLRDSTHYHYYDAFSGTEQFKFYGYYHYNDDDQPLMDLYVNYYGADPSYFRYDYEYNAEKQLSRSTSLHSLVSANGPWENWLKDDYTYDAQGRNDHYIGQLGTSTGWENYYQETFWFDDVTPADSSLYELWDATVPAWGNYRRYFNYYFPSGDLKRHHEDEWKMAAASWSYLTQDDYTYYPDGKLLTLKSLSYDVNQVSLSQSDSFLYRADGKVDTTFSSNQTSLNGTINRFITKSEYDAEGHLIRNTSVRKINGPTMWIYSSRESFAPGDGYYSDDYSYENQETYNESTQSFDILWDINRQYAAVGGDRVLYVEQRRQRNNQGVLAIQSIDSVWYHLATVNTSVPVASGRADCQFANPFRPGSSIVCQAPDQNSMMNIRISNMSGQVVAQGRVMPGEAWHPGADWPAGPYFLTAWQNGRYLGERKMVVVK